MKYRRFGRTELSMPVISCGGMRYQHKWNDLPWEDIPKKGQENIERTLAAALDNGIHHIETARGYGSSEMQLGYALKQFPRDSYILQTKVAPQATQEEFLKMFETSMAYLQQETVDLFSLHGLNNRKRIELAMRPGGCLEAALKLKEQGRVKHIGFSTHAATHEIIELIDSGAFEYLNLHWYFTNQLNTPAIEAAARQDMGVFIISPNDKGGQLYNPPQKLIDLCDPLHPMAFNDLFCLSNPHVHTLSCGAAKPSDFELHVETVKNMDNHNELVMEIVEKIKHEVSQIMGPDWYQNWHMGIPDWRELPHSINVKDIVRMWTWAKSIDLVDFGTWRYNMLSADDVWILGNPVKKFDKKLMLQKLSNSPYAEKIIEILHDAHSLFAKEKK
jgi:predicted aldo/keto reductase-like oxidoreductase